MHSSWRSYFENIEKEVEEPYVQPPGLGQSASKTMDLEAVLQALKDSGFAAGNTVKELGSSEDIK